MYRPAQWLSERFVARTQQFPDNACLMLLACYAGTVQIQTVRSLAAAIRHKTLPLVGAASALYFAVVLTSDSEK